MADLTKVNEKKMEGIEVGNIQWRFHRNVILGERGMRGYQSEKEEKRESGDKKAEQRFHREN